MAADHSILVTNNLDSQVPQFKLVIYFRHARCSLEIELSGLEYRCAKKYVGHLNPLYTPILTGSALCSVSKIINETSVRTARAPDWSILLSIFPLYPELLL